MKEIDDRYPEFAEPYEPVKGGKHHKALTLGRSMLPLVVAAVVGTTLIVSAVKEHEVEPTTEPTTTPTTSLFG